MNTLNAKHHVWKKTCTIPSLMHSSGRIELWGCISAAGIRRLVRIKAKMNGEEYREIIDENLHQSAQDLRLE